MGIFKNIIKKVALAAAVVAGKRILSKVVTNVIDGDHKPEVEATPSSHRASPKTGSNRRRAPAKSKTATTKPNSTAKPKAAAVSSESVDTPKKPTRTRTRKPRTAKPQTSETAAETASPSSTTAVSK